MMKTNWKSMMGWGAAVALAALSLGATGCRKDGKDESKPPRTEEFSWGPVHVALTVSPSVVDVTRGVELVFAITAPPEIDVTLPSLNDRAQGFTVGGQFEDDPVVKDGKKVRAVHVQLTPVVAEKYRIAPMAIEYVDKAVQPPSKSWFPTKPIVLEKASLTRDEPGHDIKALLDPVWIAPTFKSVVWWILAAFALAAAGWGLWKLATRVRENIQLAKMSPRERALKELEKLLARDLIRQNRVKDFYVELTMIVRRYIERRHGLRAPEQTTEEFLAAAAADNRFQPDVLRKLRAFLQAADLVKFAADRPDEPSIGNSTDTARGYIEQDSASEAAGEQNGGK
jgi:hypothetical protein